MPINVNFTFIDPSQCNSIFIKVFGIVIDKFGSSPLKKNHTRFLININIS